MGRLVTPQTLLIMLIFFIHLNLGACALIWPGCFGEHILGLFGLYSSSLSKSVGFVSISGKASLVSISAAILSLRSWHVYFPLEFEFRGKSCVE